MNYDSIQMQREINEFGMEPRDMTEAGDSAQFDHDIKEIEALLDCLAEYSLPNRRAHFKQIIDLASQVSNLMFSTWGEP